MSCAPCPPSPRPGTRSTPRASPPPTWRRAASTVPTDPAERAAQMLPDPLRRLPLGRLHRASRSTASGSTSALAGSTPRPASVDEADVLIAPLVGLRMSLPRLHAAARRALDPRRRDRGADRGDAQRGDGPRRLGAAVPGGRRAGREPDSAEAALRQLRELISVMRLFKGGGIGLGPTPSPRPARATGAGSRPAPRPPAPGGYRLSEAEAASLAELAERSRRARIPTAPSPGRSGASRWAARGRPRWRASATTCSRCARCSTGRARSGHRCRCAPRR